MKDKARGRVVDALSAAAVVVSLVFVAWEIHQNTAAQRSQTREAISEQSYDFLMQLATNEQLMAAWHGIWDAPDGNDVWRGKDLSEHDLLTHMDTVRAETAMLSLLRRLENVYLQHREGVFGRSVLDEYAFRSPLYQTNHFEHWWKTTNFRDLFDPDFVTEFDAANGLQ